jgi:hypothetical protein
MPKCAYTTDGSVCGRDTVALSRFCSVHAETGAPESVVSPSPAPWESGKSLPDQASVFPTPKVDDDTSVW